MPMRIRCCPSRKLLDPELAPRCFAGILTTWETRGIMGTCNLVGGSSASSWDFCCWAASAGERGTCSTGPGPGPSTARRTRSRARFGSRWSTRERTRFEMTVDRPANVAAYYRAPVEPRVAGEIESIKVAPGSQVKKNEMLVKVKVPDLDADAEQKGAIVGHASRNGGRR